MRLRGKIERLEYAPEGCHKVMVRVRASSGQLESLYRLEGKELDIGMSEARERRTLPENAYAWAIMTEIARVLGTSSGEVYVQMLMRYAPLAEDERGYFALQLDEDDARLAFLDFHWKHIGTRDGVKSFVLMKGMSQYDKAEMGAFLDRIIEEAQELGIETDKARHIKTEAGRIGGHGQGKAQAARKRETRG